MYYAELIIISRQVTKPHFLQNLQFQDLFVKRCQYEDVDVGQQ